MAMTVEIYSLSEMEKRFEEVVQYFWRQWGTEANYLFYKDCMEHSLRGDNPLPRFFAALADGVIVGSCALLRNDLNSRQDLEPWFACLHVEPDWRGKKLGAMLQDHAAEQAALAGYGYLYLSTDLIGYYEKNGWEPHGDAYLFNGDRINVYRKEARLS